MLTGVAPDLPVLLVKADHRMTLSIALTDLKGATLLQRTLDVAASEQQLPLDLRGLPAGRYLLRATTPGLLPTTLPVTILR